MSNKILICSIGVLLLLVGNLYLLLSWGRWLGMVVLWLSRARRWGLDSTPGVDGDFERVES